MTDVEPTAEAPAQESSVEPKNPETSEVVEIKLATYNLKKAGQATISITLNSKDIKLEPGDQMIRINKDKLIDLIHRFRTVVLRCIGKTTPASSVEFLAQFFRSGTARVATFGMPCQRYKIPLQYHDKNGLT
ncbi:MAG: hypothetical protein E7030_06750 [Akkermansiaceae bacterium]|nr:hypothetical protein [Akkermansiaceae bacterium]